MTEDEAKLMRCCGPEGCGVVGNPDYEGGPCSRWCIGSACMAWRWIDKAGTKEDGTANYYAGSWKGYCGLAGKP